MKILGKSTTICRSRLAAVALVSVAIAQPVLAQEGLRADRIVAASALEEECLESEQTEVGRLNVAHCLGVITGVADAAMTMNAAFRGVQTICLAEADDAESMRLAYLSFLRRNPDVRQLPAATAVIAMLQTQYPCSNETER